MKTASVSSRRKLRFFIYIVVVSYFFLSIFSADNAEASDIYNRLANSYKSASGEWVTNLLAIAKSLFYKLALIELVWSALWWMWERDDPNQVISKVLKKIMGLMFFWAILINFDTWVPAIIDGFISAGKSASGLKTLTPTAVFDRGLEITGNLLTTVGKQGMFDLMAGKAILASITALGIVIAFAIIAGQMLVTLVESYICVSGGIIFLGFAGSRWTSTFAEKYISYCVSVGTKLFFTYLIVGAGDNITAEWVVLMSKADVAATEYLEVFAGGLVYLFLACQIPSLAASSLSGAASLTFGGLASNTAGIAAAGVGTAMGGVGLAAAGSAGASALAGGGSGLMKVAGATGKAASAGFQAAGGTGGVAGGKLGAAFRGTAGALKSVAGNVTSAASEATKDTAKGFKNKFMAKGEASAPGRFAAHMEKDLANRTEKGATEKETASQGKASDQDGSAKSASSEENPTGTADVRSRAAPPPSKPVADNESVKQTGVIPPAIQSNLRTESGKSTAGITLNKDVSTSEVQAPTDHSSSSTEAGRATEGSGVANEPVSQVQAPMDQSNLSKQAANATAGANVPNDTVSQFQGPTAHSSLSTDVGNATASGGVENETLAEVQAPTVHSSSSTEAGRATEGSGVANEPVSQVQAPTGQSNLSKEAANATAGASVPNDTVSQFQAPTAHSSLSTDVGNATASGGVENETLAEVQAPTGHSNLSMESGQVANNSSAENTNSKSTSSAQFTGENVSNTSGLTENKINTGGTGFAKPAQNASPPVEKQQSNKSSGIGAAVQKQVAALKALPNDSASVNASTINFRHHD